MVMAGLLGGVAMYAWSTVAHMVTPLGDAGIKQVMNEEVLLGVTKVATENQPGLYMFPNMDLPAGPPTYKRQANMSEYAQKLALNPSGLIIYEPPGSQPMMASQLVIEFLTEMAEAFLAIFFLTQTRIASFGGRVWFITLVGVLAALTTNIPYWNWYHFPVDYTAALMFTEIVGFLAAGIVAAVVLNRRMPAKK